MKHYDFNNKRPRDFYPTSLQEVQDEGPQRPFVIEIRWAEGPLSGYSWCQARTYEASTPRLAALKSAINSEHSNRPQLRVTGTDESDVTYFEIQEVKEGDPRKVSFHGPVTEFKRRYVLVDIEV